MTNIHVYTTRILFEKDATRARKVARFVLDVLKKKEKSVDIFLLSLSKIQKINKTWHKKDAPTNVLSFAQCDIMGDFPKQFCDKNFLGEIYICPDFVRIHKQSFDHMVVHGMLHLLGYDHIKKGDAIQMEKIEQKILQLIDKNNK